jgi:hypothetical protein
MLLNGNQMWELWTDMSKTSCPWYLAVGWMDTWTDRGKTSCPWYLAVGAVGWMDRPVVKLHAPGTYLWDG